MKLAIIHPCASTGGWNYFYLLTKHLKLLNPSWDITFFTRKLNNVSAKKYRNDLASIGIHVETLNIPHCPIYAPHEKRRSKQLQFKFKKLKYNFLKKWTIPHHQKILEGYDIIFYSWPYDIEPIPLNKPTFFMMHDFHYAHFFGFHSGNVYTHGLFMHHYKLHTSFFKIGEAIVSSNFTKQDLLNIYPDYKGPVHVIYMSKFNDYPQFSKEKISSILKKYNITSDYILCANNAMHHKNMGQILGGYYYVKQKYPHIKFIATGCSTKGVKAFCNTPYYCDHTVDLNQDSYDIVTLGELPLDDFIGILQGAKLVINGSLFEGGPGSCLDGWSLGVPVAMSNLPVFKEIADFLGTRAEFFDPRNAPEIGQAMINIIDTPEKAKENATISQAAMNNYSWETVAKKYTDVFLKNNNLK